MSTSQATPATHKALPWWAQIMLNSLAGSLAQGGEPFLVGLLQKQFEADPVLYKAIITSLHAGIAPLTQLVEKTPTKIDDGFVLAFDEAIRESAAANSINLKTLANAPVNDAVQ